MEPTMRRLSFSMSLVAFVLATGDFGAAADEKKLGGARSDAIVPALRVECSLHRKPGELLDPPSTAAIQPVEQFLAQEHFKEDITPTAAVKISWLGASFVRRFAVKVEAAGVTSLQTFSLRVPSNDRDVIAELGDRHETRLADVWCLLSRQAKGEDGALQTNSVPNIFFVRDGAGELGVVDSVWGGAGWEIGASPVGDKRTWAPGTRVISR
ncbi:hypothetical protein ACFIOY_03700 [Bradyrhizobium sp. TZ2]